MKKTAAPRFDDDIDDLWEHAAAPPPRPAASRTPKRRAAPRRAAPPPVYDDMWAALPINMLELVSSSSEVLEVKPEKRGLLQQRHPFPCDEMVKFVDEGHLYYARMPDGSFRRNKLIVSVTSIWSLAKTEFPKHMVAKKTAERNVRNLGAALSVLPARPNFMQLSDALGEPAAMVLENDSHFMQLIGGSARGRHDQLAYALATYQPAALEHKFGGLTPKAVIAPWDANGKSAAERGTFVHAQIENFYNEEPYDQQLPEMHTIFPEMLNDYPEISPRYIFRTELSVINEKSFVVGQLDALFRSPTKPGMFSICDWKNTKELTKRESCTPAFRAAFPDFIPTKANFYGLQLGLYRWLLMQYGVQIDEMFLMCVHVNHVGHRKISVPVMDAEVKWLLQRHAERLAVLVAAG